MKRSWPQIRLEHLWLGLPFFLIVIKGFLFPLPLLDFWWHLKMGEIIATTHSIPHTDLFSFTAAGKPFIVQNWLSEVIYYGVYQLGGFPLLVFLNTLLLAAALLPVYLLCREATSRTKLAVFAAFVAAFVYFGNMRPQVFSFLLFAIYYWVLDGYRFGRRDRLWTLPFLMMLWVNLHGAFIVGLGLIALYLGSESVRRLVDKGDVEVLSVRQLRKLGFVLLACGAATLFNPESYRLYDYVRTVMADQASQKFVMEWQPPRIDTLQGALLFYGLFYMVAGVFAVSRKRLDLTDLALCFGFSVFGLTATRNSIWFGIIIAPILARYLEAADVSRIWGQRSSRLSGLPAAQGDQPLSVGKTHYRLNFVIAAAALAIVVIASPWIRPGLYHTSLLESPTPVKAMDYIEQHALQGNIFHPQIFGDYLIWRLYPHQRSFFDGRVHLFGEAFVRDISLFYYDSHWEDRLVPFDIQHLLLSKAPGEKDDAKMIENARKSRNWTVLFEDDGSILFTRSRDANAPKTVSAGHLRLQGEF